MAKYSFLKSPGWKYLEQVSTVPSLCTLMHALNKCLKMHGSKEIVDKNLTKTKFDDDYFAYSSSSSLLLCAIKFTFFSASKASNLTGNFLFCSWLSQLNVISDFRLTIKVSNTRRLLKLPHLFFLKIHFSIALFV